MDWKRWARQLVTISAVAGLVGACGGEERKDAAARDDAGREQSAVGTAIALRGCVQSAPGTREFVLTTIEIEPAPGGPGDPGGSAARAGITEWAWVKLQPGDHELDRHLGERVSVTGVVVQSGRNTIGTPGTWGNEVPSGDKSQAASDEHYAEKQKLEMGRIARQSLADGTAAEIRVEQVRPTGDRCAEELAPEQR